MKKKPLSEVQRDRETVDRLMGDMVFDINAAWIRSVLSRAIHIGRKRGEKHAVELAKRAIVLRDLLHTVPTKPTS
jgi:hypothetical protein